MGILKREGSAEKTAEKHVLHEKRPLDLCYLSGGILAFISIKLTVAFVMNICVAAVLFGADLRCHQVYLERHLFFSLG